MKAPNLHLPHLRTPHIGGLHFSLPHAEDDHKPLHMRALSNVWALMLAAIVGAAVVTGLWMSRG
jgi:hypothetical protein